MTWPRSRFHAEWDPHDPETSVGVDAVNEMMAAGMLVMSCVGEIVKRCGLDSTPELLLVNGALLAPCRRWIGKCKCARPQNEFTRMG